MQEYQDIPLGLRARVVVRASVEPDRLLRDQCVGAPEACCRLRNEASLVVLAYRLLIRSADGFELAALPM